METNKSSDTGESKESKQSSGTQNNNGGFDFSQFLNDKNLADILKHLLSGAGAMAGNYFIWIKPLQDKMEAMTKTIEGQEKRIKELEENQEKLFEKLHYEGSENKSSFMGKEKDFFNSNRHNTADHQYFRKSGRAYL